MQKTSVIFLMIFFTLNSAWSLEQEDIIQKATFATDPRSAPAEYHEHREIGLVSDTQNNYGLIFSRSLAQDRSGWIKALKAGGRRPVLMERVAASPEMAALSTELILNEQIQMGVDQIFHLTSNRYWGFILGAGLGVARAEYESKYYPQLCNFICGYDSSRPTQKNVTDLYANLSLRVGVAFLETRFLGAKGDLQITLNPEILRTPAQPQFIGPDGREVKPMGLGVALAIEGLLTI